jgi:streptogramin lyase
MPTFLLHHQHRPHECAIAIAAWKGFDSPLRGGRPLGSCATGGHQVWWAVLATDSAAALAQLPQFVADRTAAEEVSEVPLP